MPLKSLSSRAIIGEFYQRLEQDLGANWVNPISMYFTSDQESETYRWLGQVPAMRQWVGGRMVKSLRDAGLTLVNVPYESTLGLPVDWIRRDKTGQAEVRIAEQAARANAHWASLLSTLIANGASTTCYDGSYFFADAHSEGNSGSQDNNIGGAAATGTQPTTVEMADAILACAQAILGFKDDQGELMNEGARRFQVHVPLAYMGPAAGALGATVIADTVSRTNQLLTVSSLGGFQFDLAINPRLSWTDKFCVFRADGMAKPFIRQEEVPIEMSAQAEGSKAEFENREHQYGIFASRTAGYGYWQHACLYTFT